MVPPARSCSSAAPSHDFIEKYSEAYWTWVADWGFGVATFDWRGQGLSGRLGRDAHRGHGDFDRWTDDLDAIMNWFVETLPPPRYVVAHSMGGHLMLRRLARGGGPVERAVLLAPMLGIRTGPVRPETARRLADLAVRFRLGGRFGLLQRGYGGWQQRPERQALLTGCPDRFADEHWWIASQPELALGGVTWGWLASASRSIEALFAPGVLESIDTPLLILAGERERLVDLAAIERAAVRLPRCEFRLIPDGRHELLREADAVRSATQAAIRGFLSGPDS
jgi:lysophospholipase